MIKQEFLAFLTADELIKFLYLSKLFNSLIEEQYKNNWQNLAKRIAEYWLLDYE